MIQGVLDFQHTTCFCVRGGFQLYQSVSFVLQAELRWMHRRPLAFQAFRNHHYLRNWKYVFSCDIMTNLPPTSDLKYFDLPFCVQSDLLNKTYLQPKVLFPNVKQNKSCTLMYLANLEEPEWINIDCNDKLLVHIVFEESVTKILTVDTANRENSECCPNTHVMKNGICYLFLWLKSEHHKNAEFSKLCSLHQSEMNEDLEQAMILMFLLKASLSPFPPVLVFNKRRGLLRNTFKELGKKIKHLTTIVNGTAEGFHICITRKIQEIAKNNAFTCSEGARISLIFMCDGTSDCPGDNSDENKCTCYKSGDTSKKLHFCRYYQNEMNETTCGILYYQTMTGQCEKFFAKLAEPIVSHDWAFCNDINKIRQILWNDLITDCDDDSDEPELISLLQTGFRREIETGFATHCFSQQQLPCSPGHSRCFIVPEICYYKLEEGKYLSPCRNGGHLQNCKEFECNMKFKCSRSYCIPWSYVCNSKVDCPNEDDELVSFCFSHMKCNQMFKCKDTFFCIHLQNVCDGFANCPAKDDEWMCDLQRQVYPEACQCLAYAAVCQDFPHLHLATKDLPYLSFSVFNITLGTLNHLVAHIKESMFVRLENNSIKEICFLRFPLQLYVLHVRANKIQNLQGQCIGPLVLLHILRLDQNRICTLESHSFSSLPSLSMLNLSENALVSMPPRLFDNAVHLSVLSVDDLDFSYIHTEVFFAVEINVIITQDFHLCCVAPPDSLCSSKSPWFVSCEHLLPNMAVQLNFIIVSFLILLVNSLSILMHKLAKKIQETFRQSTIALNLNDTLFAIYLEIIWIVHYFYNDNFQVEEKKWRSGIVCFASSILILWFSLQSQMLLVFVSLSRLRVIIKPIDTQFKRADFVMKHIILIGVISLCFSTAISLPVKFTGKTLPSNLCSPFVDPTNSEILLKVITSTVVVTQMVTSFAILVLHSLLFHHFSESQKNVKALKSKAASSTALIVQLVLVTSTNILCWLPANGVYIATMLLERYPSKLVVWTTVAVLPVNSLINPLIFTLACVRNYLESN